MNCYDDSLKKHYEWKGKIEVVSRVKVDSKEALSLAYTPGVAEACKEINKNVDLSFSLTRRWNTIAVITDGTAILGLGDIGPEAGMPVMEGKCALFKSFGNVDAVPICLRTKDTEEIIKTIKTIAGSFGGINLEDISAPRCFEIEKRLIDELDIPVFHDDQHGTKIVVMAALINALKLAKKKLSDITVVVNGAGAAGVSIGKFLIEAGVKDVIMVDRFGIICEGDKTLNKVHEELAHITNKHHLKGDLSKAMVGSDVFIGVSVANCVTKDMIKSMNDSAIVFPLANPVPEISRQDAIDAGAFIVGTGSSQYPNQINNVLVFPGVFRASLDLRVEVINTEMMMAAAYGIASCVSDDELNVDYILPYAWDQKAHGSVRDAVKEAAIKTKVAKFINKQVY